LKWSGEKGSSSENLAGCQPIEKDFSPVFRDYEVSAMTTGEQIEALRRVFVVDDHRRGVESPVFGKRENGVKFGLSQAR
jgi:hypothetical protein